MEEKKTEKPIMNLVVIGNVDSGKSTTCGNLLYSLGGVNKRELESLQKEADTRKKSSFGLAYVMDKTKAERDRGITIDCSMKQFYTNNFNYTLIDAPGHKDFVKNMITGTQQADIAMLMVSAHKGEFESGFSKDGNTKDHALLAYTLGVKKMIVCVNKMDQESVKFSEERYKEVKEEVEAYLMKKIGYKSVQSIPISGFMGDNLLQKSQNMPWYKGPTLVDILDSQAAAKRPTDKPLRIPIQNAFQIGGIGTVVSGKVETGVLKPGMQVMIVPGGKVTKVQSIEAHKQQLPQAIPGDNVGINLRNVSVKDISKGMVLCEVSNSPCTATKEFIAQVMIMNHPKGIKAGYSPVLSCHSAQFSASFTEILAKIDKKTGKPAEGDLPDLFKNGESILVRMKVEKPVVLENFADFPSLGRFVVRDMKKVVAIGIIKKI